MPNATVERCLMRGLQTYQKAHLDVQSSQTALLSSTSTISNMFTGLYKPTCYMFKVQLQCGPCSVVYAAFAEQDLQARTESNRIEFEVHRDYPADVAINFQSKRITSADFLANLDQTSQCEVKFRIAVGRRCTPGAAGAVQFACTEFR